MRKGIQDMHLLQELVRLHRLGVGAGVCAKQLGLARKTERSYRRKLDHAGLLAGSPEEPLPASVIGQGF